MAYFINIYRLLCSIHTDEVGLEKFVLASTDGRKVTYEGHDINVDDLKPLIERELDRYNTFVKEHLFFGSAPPSDILPKIEIEDKREGDHKGYTDIELSYRDEDHTQTRRNKLGRENRKINAAVLRH